MQTSGKQVGWAIIAVIVAVTVIGCNKSQSAKATAEQLQKSFEKADASTKQEVVQAGEALQSSNYVAAIGIMNRVVRTQPIDEVQKKAVDALMIQTRQAVQQNPKLDSAELYKAMSELLVRVHGEN
jgi:transcriptional regulator GlxA family with amidase domain